MNVKERVGAIATFGICALLIAGLTWGLGASLASGRRVAAERDEYRRRNLNLEAQLVECRAREAYVSQSRTRLERILMEYDEGERRFNAALSAARDSISRIGIVTQRIRETAAKVGEIEDLVASWGLGSGDSVGDSGGKEDVK